MKGLTQLFPALHFHFSIDTSLLYFHFRLTLLLLTFAFPLCPASSSMTMASLATFLSRASASTSHATSQSQSFPETEIDWSSVIRQVSDSLLLAFRIVCSCFVDLLRYPPTGDHTPCIHFRQGLSIVIHTLQNSWLNQNFLKTQVYQFIAVHSKRMHYIEWFVGMFLNTQLSQGCGWKDGLVDHNPPLPRQHLQRHQQQLTQCQGNHLLWGWISIHSYPSQGSFSRHV